MPFLSIVLLYFHGVMLLTSYLISKLPYNLIGQDPLARDQPLANFTSPFFLVEGGRMCQPLDSATTNISVLPPHADESIIINRLWHDN